MIKISRANQQTILIEYQHVISDGTIDHTNEGKDSQRKDSMENLNP